MTRDPNFKPLRDPIAIMDDLLHDAAEQAAEDAAAYGERTDEELLWARGVAAVVEGLLAAHRRELTSGAGTSFVRRGVKIPPEIAALDHDTLVMRLEQLRAQPGVQISHFDLTGLTVHDLQTLLTIALESSSQWKR